MALRDLTMETQQGYLPALYKDRASYLDLYVLDACGKGRRHIQLDNQYDSCCFYGVFHLTWTANVGKAVSSTGAGDYSFYLDPTHRQHQISSHAIEKAIDPALGIRAAGLKAEPPDHSRDRLPSLSTGGR